MHSWYRDLEVRAFTHKDNSHVLNVVTDFYFIHNFITLDNLAFQNTLKKSEDKAEGSQRQVPCQ